MQPTPQSLARQDAFAPRRRHPEPGLEERPTRALGNGASPWVRLAETCQCEA